MDVSLATVGAVAVHRIGNKMREEGYLLSSREIPLTERLSDLFLRHYLLSIVEKGEECLFDHPSDVELNEVRHFCSAMEKGELSFIDGSKSLAKHLYEASAHPNIGGGEFIIIEFSGIRVDGEDVKGIGLFRIEAKDDFLDITEKSGNFELVDRIGISINKIQKGALVIAKLEKVLSVDTLGQKTKYWKDNFLQVRPEDTSLVRAKAVGAILKAVAERVETPGEAANFTSALRDQLADSEGTTIASIRQLSNRFLAPADVTAVVKGVENKSGIVFDEAANISAHELSKYTRDIVRKSRIADGVALVISKADSRVSSIEVKKTYGGIRAIVEIKVEEKK